MDSEQFSDYYASDIDTFHSILKSCKRKRDKDFLQNINIEKLKDFCFKNSKKYELFGRK